MHVQRFFYLQMVNAGKVTKCEFIGFVEGGVSSLLKVLFQNLLHVVLKLRMVEVYLHYSIHLHNVLPN